MIDISPPRDSEQRTAPVLGVIEPTPVKQAEFSYAGEPIVPHACAPFSSYRVLYRGSLSFSTSEADVPLEGVCFVAHFDSGSPSGSSLLSSPLPLALESQRGRSSLSIISAAPTNIFNDRLDDSIDLRMYIHPQSLITRAYFERLLCMEYLTRPDGRTKACLRVQLGDGHDESDDVVIYGQLMTDAESPCSAGFAELCIRVARVLPAPPKSRPAPRPDDPLPRTERFPTAQVPFNVKRRPSLREIPYPRKHPRLDQGSKQAVPANAEQCTGSAIAARGKSFRVISDGAAIGAVGSTKGQIRKKSLLSVVSTIRENCDVGCEADVFWTSSEQDTEVVTAGNKRSNGSFNAAKVPSKKNAFSLPEVTTEEDSLYRSNKETIKKMVISILGTRGIAKDNHEFKELYQAVVRGTIFALRQLMGQRRIERDEARTIVGTHLKMYLPGSEFALYTPEVT